MRISRSTSKKRNRGALARATEGHRVDLLVVVVTLILFSVAWPTLPLTHQVPAPLMPIIAALAAFPFVLVKANPPLGWAISAVTALLVPLVFDLAPGWEYPWQVVHLMVLLSLVFAVSLRAAVPVIAVSWITTILLFVAYMPGSDGIGWSVGVSAIVAFGLLIRWLVLSRKQLAEQEEVSELERTRRTILEEKAKIARDLHDVVAHHMSLVVVQAQSAAYRLDDVSPSAAAEFESIGATAREALNEIRGMLGVLRSDGLRADTPQPGARDIESLLRSSRRAGVPLTWTSRGSTDAISAGSGLVLFRILQESLSNASRHAPDSDVSVTLDFGPDVAYMRVTNGPSAATEVASGIGNWGHGNGGHGIVGMKDRASAALGWLDARPQPDGGFEVTLRLPAHPAGAEMSGVTAADPH